LDTGIQPNVRIVSVEGVFDHAAAAIIRAKLIDTACDVVVLDFGRAREVSDVALAHLAGTLTGLERPHVMLRGLGHHQERMLRYLHLDRSVLDIA
jgi:hypothetical protein